MSTSAPAAQAQPHAPLWPQPIPIIGGTGEKGVGKSKFGLNICPQPHATLVYDLEQSSAGYEQEYARIGVPFDRVDIQKEMHTVYPNGYKPIQLWEWWLKHIRAIPAGKYRVIMVDPVTDLERGLADWVNANPTAFGHTAAQYQKMSGIMWGDVKDYFKSILADICARCETFYFTAHLGAEFQGNTATGRKKPRGKETLNELASLYLWFERKPDAAGVRPNVPAAKVEKGRMEIAQLVDGEVVSYSVLPPRMPVATPKAIRDYFKNPAGKGALSDGERDKPEMMSDAERLRLETAKAEAQAEVARLHAAQPIAHAPEQTGDSEAWVINFTTAIQQATADTLGELVPQIKLARERGHINDGNLADLKSLYASRKAHLEGLASTVPD